MRMSDGQAKKLTNDFNSYFDLSATKDGKQLVVRQRKRHANLWYVPGLDASKARQMTFGKRAFEGKQGIELLPDGKVLLVATRDSPFDLWTTDFDGSELSRLTDNVGEVKRFPSVSVDGKFVYFDSTLKKVRRIRRIGVENGVVTDVTTGNDGRDSFPEVSPDDNYVYFVRTRKTARSIVRRDLASGKEQIIEVPEGPAPRDLLSLSPDGKTSFVSIRSGGRPSFRMESN